MKRAALIAIAVLYSNFLFSQLDSLTYALKHGKVQGYWRTFFMATENQGELKDWNALATGGLLKYETGAFKGVRIGIGYYSSYNLGISNVAALDTTTDKLSRYELGLFDVKNPKQRSIHILGELYLRYKHKGHQATIGRMKLKTPFLNPEDGRMIPVLEQGVWYENNSVKPLFFSVGWLTHIAPRSYSRFEAVKNTMGIYPVGLNPDGTPSGYFENMRTAGLGVFSVKYKKPNWEIQGWDYFLENVFNLAYVIGHYEWKKEKYAYKLSGQYALQNQVNQGGNTEVNMAYFQDKLSMVWGAQFQASFPHRFIASANFNQITGHGRFLFPREWGREPFFTFQKRERLEGAGQTMAWVVDIAKDVQFKNKSLLKMKVGYGQYYRPDAKDFPVNKYAMPANDQLNLDIFYLFAGPLKGLKIEYLMAYKRAIGETYDNPNFILNKVNMWNFNLVVNYTL